MIPSFRKIFHPWGRRAEELETDLDKVFYALKYIKEMREPPPKGWRKDVQKAWLRVA